MSLRFDPASYPGWRPDGPSLVHRGGVRPVTLDVTMPARVGGPVDGPADVPVLAPGVVRWVVAYGSNACPDRLVDKGLDRRGVVLLPATVCGWVAAFEGRPTAYGAVPLTLVPDPGVVTATWLVGVHVDDTPTVDASEGRVVEGVAEDGDGPADALRAPAGAYRLAHVGELTVADELRLDDAVAFVPGPRTQVQVDAEGRWRTWPRFDQAAAATHLEVSGPTAPAPLVGGVVAGPWPTPGPVRADKPLRGRSARQGQHGPCRRLGSR